MKSRIKSLIAFSLFACATVVNAQPLECKVYTENNIKTAAAQENGYWWKYFKGGYEDLIADYTIGFGNNITYPAKLNVAMKLDCKDADLKGRLITKISFLFWNFTNLEDIKIWMSNNLPASLEQSTICAYSLKKESLTPGVQLVLELPTPYKITNQDVYIGYEVVQTTEQPSPIAIDASGMVKDGAFYTKVNADNWMDLTGQPYGNPILSAYLEYLDGDANTDGYIDVLDVTSTVDYVLNKQASVINTTTADIDKNGEINIVDVESIVDMILEKYKAPVKNAAAFASDMLMAEKTDEGFSLKLNADNEYRGFQMDVVLPVGADINNIVADASVAATHNVKYVRLEGNRYRVIVTSINGANFNTDNLLSIVSSTEDIKIENIVFATSDLQEKRFDRIALGDVTAIDNVKIEDGKRDIHDINGVKVNPDNVINGVYIINGKKVVVK